MIYSETFIQSPNYGAGANACEGLVLHHTGGGYEGAVAWCTNPASQVSYHCIIAKDGRRAVLMKDVGVAWHAGRSRFRGKLHCNAFMLGVAFEGNTNEQPLSSHQLTSFLQWYRPRAAKYGWSCNDVTDHRTVATPAGRKNDLHPTELDRVLYLILHDETL